CRERAGMPDADKRPRKPGFAPRLIPRSRRGDAVRQAQARGAPALPGRLRAASCHPRQIVRPTPPRAPVARMSSFLPRLRAMAVCVFAVACVSRGHAEDSARRPLTFDDLLARKRVSEPQVSPDGAQVVYVLTEVLKSEN